MVAEIEKPQTLKFKKGWYIFSCTMIWMKLLMQDELQAIPTEIL